MWYLEYLSFESAIKPLGSGPKIRVGWVTVNSHIFFFLPYSNFPINLDPVLIYLFGFQHAQYGFIVHVPEFLPRVLYRQLGVALGTDRIRSYIQRIINLCLLLRCPVRIFYLRSLLYAVPVSISKESEIAVCTLVLFVCWLNGTINDILFKMWQNIYNQIQSWRFEPNTEYIWPNTVLKMWTKSRIYMTKYSSEDVNQIQNIYYQIQFWRCEPNTEYIWPNTVLKMWPIVGYQCHGQIGLPKLHHLNIS